VFEAQPGAATGGFLAAITATPADPKVVAPSKTAFDPAFVVGQPGQTVYTRHYFDRTAVAVTDAAPRKWKTAVTAVSDAGKGPVWVSSQLFTLEVATPPVTLTAERPAVEQGASTQLFCKVAVAAPFEGKAKVKVLGLPAKVTVQDLELTKDTKELAFPLVADKTSPAGKHGGIFCQVVLEQNGDVITLATGGTELRIDVPIAPKTAAAPPPPMPTAQPMPMGQPMRRLTRLEQLRLEQEAREKAGQPATPPPAPPPAPKP
jgi:hypothetical protein